MVQLCIGIERLVGIVGIKIIEGKIEIRHIAVKIGDRRNGTGKFMIDWIRSQFPGRVIIAETDKDAVGFYRKYGFQCVPYKSKWGNIRYTMEYGMGSDLTRR